MMMRLVNLLLVAVLMVSAMAVVNAKHQNRMLYVELRNLQQQRDALNVDWGRLQLEQSTLATHSRIERFARKRLDMQSINYNEVVIVKL